MSITVYKDNAANAIFVQDANGVQFLNSLQAYINAPTDTVISIRDLSRNLDIFTSIDYAQFVNANEEAWGVDAIDTVNNLNAIFLSSGSSGLAPVITSNLTINAVEGDIINYELIADGAVGYEWDNLPAGIVTVEGNLRKLIGTLPAGTYTPTVKAINYFGVDTQTITINVSNPPFANTKSVKFEKNDWLGANAAMLDPILGRTGNGSGSGDAWSIGFWFKAGSSNNQGNSRHTRSARWFSLG